MQQDQDGYTVVITTWVPGNTEGDAANNAHTRLVKYGIGAGSVEIQPCMSEHEESGARLPDCLFEEEPQASLEHLFEDEEPNAV